MPIRGLIAIDPGTVQSGLVVLTRFTGILPFEIEQARTLDNSELLGILRYVRDDRLDEVMACVIEKPACYGMPVGEEIFETVYWTGRFAQAFGGDTDKVDRIPRMAVKMHLCHDSRARDSNVRQALIDRFGPPGNKKAPGFLYGIHGDLWAALALAVTWWDQHASQESL